MAGVLGIINTNTLSGDAAVMAFMQGDSGTTTARAALELRWHNLQLLQDLIMVLI
jgi:hypothetical protein